MDIASAVQEFSKLTFDQQKEKLSIMLEEIKDVDPLFLELSNMINTRKDLTIAFFIGAYQHILELGKALGEYSTDKKQTKISALQEKLKMLYEKEMKERTIEQEEAEELIKNM